MSWKSEVHNFKREQKDQKCEFRELDPNNKDFKVSTGSPLILVKGRPGIMR